MRIRELLYRGEMVVVPPKVIIQGYPPVMDSPISSLCKHGRPPASIPSPIHPKTRKQ